MLKGYRWIVLLALLMAACTCGAPQDEDAHSEEPTLYRLRLTQADDLSAPGLLEPQRPHVSQIVSAVAALATDTHAVGMFLDLGDMHGAWARSADLSDALKVVRDAGKKVHCHFQSLDNVGYVFAARSCDRLTMTPAGTLNVIGVATQSLYARQLLATVGVSADLLQVGDFKGAAEPLTRDEMSPEMRQNLSGLLDDLHALLLQAVSTRANVPLDRAQALVDQGPFFSGNAKTLHLVDDQAWDDGALQAAREATHAARVRTLEVIPAPEPVTLANVLSALTDDADDEETDAPHIVVAHLDGEITDAEASGVATGRSGPFVRAMREFARDANVKAVVLRINSPGGSALASDEMWHAVRRVAEVKPVIVSVGDMAASGGYYIASAAQRIFAHPGSIVGSIGVVGGKMSLQSLAETHGVHATTISRGQNATWMSSMQTFTATERVTVLAMMHDTYDRFLRRVAAGRGRPVAAIEPHAAGRIFSGTDALEHGLIDELGGLRAALAYARNQAHLANEAPIVEWPRNRNWMQMLTQMGKSDDTETRVRAATLQLTQGAGAGLLQGFDGDLARDYVQQLFRFTRGPQIMLVHPYWIRIQ